MQDTDYRYSHWTSRISTTILGNEHSIIGKFFHLSDIYGFQVRCHQLLNYMETSKGQSELLQYEISVLREIMHIYLGLNLASTKPQTQLRKKAKF